MKDFQPTEKRKLSVPRRHGKRQSSSAKKLERMGAKRKKLSRTILAKLKNIINAPVPQTGKT
jgi:hypothetical protein